MHAPKPLTLVLVASLLALTGCVTQEQLRQRDEAECASYGFQRGTTEFATCLQRESLARRYSYNSWYWPPP